MRFLWWKYQRHPFRWKLQCRSRSKGKNHLRSTLSLTIQCLNAALAAKERIIGQGRLQTTCQSQCRSRSKGKNLEEDALDKKIIVSMPLSQQRKESHLVAIKDGLTESQCRSRSKGKNHPAHILTFVLQVSMPLSQQRKESTVHKPYWRNCSSQCRSRSKGKNQRKKNLKPRAICLNAALAAKERIFRSDIGFDIWKVSMPLSQQRKESKPVWLWL